MHVHAAIQRRAEIMTQSQCVMMTDTNRTILFYAAKEAQVFQTGMYDIHYSLIGVIHPGSSGTEEKTRTRTKQTTSRLHLRAER